jgi:hypothetical protein
MNLTKAHLFVILLLALVLCSFFGGACGSGSNGSDSGLEGFTDQYSSYSDMYSDSKSYAKTQDALNDRKNKPLPPSISNFDNDMTTTKYAPYHKLNGIPARQIAPGKEHLYVLKSEIVPPVCPACPSVKCNKKNGNDAGGKCPPCPPCARCPEPAFECKKVPNYDRVNDGTMPYPVLNSFSQFGM